jgi:hypothetical protein
MGPNISGPVACLRAVKPEIAACNAGSLNYLKVRADGSWAWPPHLFDNPVDKVKAYLDVMQETGTQPEFECFDVGIVRCVGMYAKNGMFEGRPKYNFVMGVESGMPADPDLLPILQKLTIAGAPWQVTAIGRGDIWPLHRRAAELGGHLRTGLEDTFYLPERQQNRLERRAGGHARPLCPRGRPCHRQPRRGACRDGAPGGVNHISFVRYRHSGARASARESGIHSHQYRGDGFRAPRFRLGPGMTGCWLPRR